MTGHIEEREGKWKTSYRYKIYVGNDPKTGVKQYDNGPSCATREEAEAGMQLRIAALMQQQAIQRFRLIMPVDPLALPGPQTVVTAAEPEPVETILVKDFLNDWLEKYLPLKEDRVTTIQAYRTIVENDLTPNFGDEYLHELRKPGIRAWVERMQRPGYSNVVKVLAPKTIQNKVRCLLSALSEAEERDLIPTNPARGVRLPRVEEKEKTVNLEHVHTIIDAMVGQWYCLPTYLAFYTGAREGELMALKCRSVDLVASTLEIRAGMVWIKGEGIVEGPPKSKSSNRIVKLDADTVEVLKAHIARQKEEYAAQARRWTPDEYLFPSPYIEGKPYAPAYLSSVFSKVVRSLGLNDLTFHYTRHAHGSLMYNATKDLTVVQQRLGHANLATTMKTYTHLVRGSDDEAVTDFARVMDRERDQALAI